MAIPEPMGLGDSTGGPAGRRSPDVETDRPPPRPATGSDPLAGQRVVVTRAAHQAEPLAAALSTAGARVERLPVLEIVPPEDPAPLTAAKAQCAAYRWVVFTSSNAVDAFLGSLDGPPPEGPRFAAVGPATRAALERRRIEVSLVAERNDAEGLAAALSPLCSPEDRILLPLAADARPVLPRRLTRLGCAVDAVTAYDKRPPHDARDRAAALFGDGPLGLVTLTSPTVARNFVGLFGDDWERRRPSLRALSIGPQTTKGLRALGIEAAAEATRPTNEGLVEAARRAARSAAP